MVDQVVEVNTEPAVAAAKETLHQQPHLKETMVRLVPSDTEVAEVALVRPQQALMVQMDLPPLSQVHQ